jgi:general stress protein YciG
MAMPTYELPKPRKSKRGFASMDPARVRELARKGGLAVPDEKRSFSKDPALAAAAGRKGGAAGKPENRSFSKDRELAVSAGRKGGKVIH